MIDIKIAPRESFFKCYACPKMHNRVHNGKVQAYCNTCHAAYMRKWRPANMEKKINEAVKIKLLEMAQSV